MKPAMTTTFAEAKEKMQAGAAIKARAATDARHPRA
jgi:hypothetical protein